MNNPLTYTDPSGHQPADSFDLDYGGPGSWGTAPSQRDLSHQVVSNKTMIGIGIAGGIMAGGSFAAGTTVATASWNGMIAMAVASFKAFCEFVGNSLIGEANKNKNISLSEVEGYNYTSDSPEDIDYGGTSADSPSPSGSSGGNQSTDNNTGAPSHGGMGPGGSGGGFEGHEENGL
jgi:hypothetical protein